MSLLTIIITAFALSMDAFAVSITNGILIYDVKAKDALKTGAYFGLFQGVMPLIGWLLGIKFQDYITKIDHWIAFILLGFIGIKMIYESFQNKPIACENSENPRACLNSRTMIMLSIATSIDALAVGVSFAFLKVPIVSSVIIIGIITFAVCFIGVFIGKNCGVLLKKNAEILGGVILILMGIKIFLEHTNLLGAMNIFN
ncbi:manganese efflux pump MntP family protein [Clostridium algidicarnis]|uniref:manganese efflux pump MntP n=1 Tax=Clostridium algidicarnis TaxID=37659 RepID=UPI001626CBFD|nr:manganese efflux pump MntP family protein [Clostridium algidicarnis]MBB6698368.1 manganese efflux pump [Clostridium algidicarnis]